MYGGDVSFIACILAAVLLGILYFSARKPAQYKQHRTLLIIVCKLMRIVLMVIYGARAVCWKDKGATSDGLLGQIFQFCVAIQKNGRLVFMIFMVMAAKVRSSAVLMATYFWMSPSPIVLFEVRDPMVEANKRPHCCHSICHASMHILILSLDIAAFATLCK